jgi:hypothetical protein
LIVFRSLAAPLLSLALVGGCASTGATGGRLDSPAIDASIVVTGLKPAERKILEEHVCNFDGVSDCEVVEETVSSKRPPKKKRGKKGKGAAAPAPAAKNDAFTKRTTRLNFKYARSLSELRFNMSKLSHPGLETQAATAELSFAGFDNLAPTVEAREPKDGAVITKKKVQVWIGVPDKDVVSVKIGGAKAKVDQDDEYTATISLEEGPNAIELSASDDAGNTQNLVLTLIRDTTPPTLEVTLTPGEGDAMLIEGTVEEGSRVFVDGAEMELKWGGKFTAESRYDPDHRVVKIRAVDPHGNEVTQVYSLKTGERKS